MHARGKRKGTEAGACVGGPSRVKWELLGHRACTGHEKWREWACGPACMRALEVDGAQVSEREAQRFPRVRNAREMD